MFTSFTVNLSVTWPDTLLSIAAILQFANANPLSMSGACLNDLYFYDLMVMKLGAPLILVAIIILCGYVNYSIVASKIEGVDGHNPFLTRPGVDNPSHSTVMTYVALFTCGVHVNIIAMWR